MNNRQVAIPAFLLFGLRSNLFSFVLFINKKEYKFSSKH